MPPKSSKRAPKSAKAAPAEDEVVADAVGTSAPGATVSDPCSRRRPGLEGQRQSAVRTSDVRQGKPNSRKRKAEAEPEAEDEVVADAVEDVAEEAEAEKPAKRTSGRAKPVKAAVEPEEPVTKKAAVRAMLRLAR